MSTSIRLVIITARLIMVRAPHSNDFLFSTCLPEPHGPPGSHCGMLPTVTLPPIARGPEVVLGDIWKPCFSVE